MWGALLVAALALLGHWAEQAQPVTGGTAGALAGAVGTGGASGGQAAGKAGAPAIAPAPAAGQAAAPAGPAAGTGSSAQGAPAPAGGGPSPAATSGGPAPAYAVPGDIAAARRQVDRSQGRESMRTVIYYVDGLSGDTALQPVEMLVPRSQAVLREAVNQLVVPPLHLQLDSGIPQGTRVLNISLSGGVATVNLSQGLLTRSGSTWANMVTYSLVYTLTENPDVQRVALQVEGKPALLEGRDLSRPLGRDDLGRRGDFTVMPRISYQP